MSTDEIIRALSAFESGTFVVVRIKTSDGGYIEVPISAIDYVPSANDEDAYLAIKLLQGAELSKESP